MKLPSTKNVGFHRGSPRLYFQSPDLGEVGFAPGTPYAIGVHIDGRIEIAAQPAGKRRVCKKVVGDKVFSIIDFHEPSLEGVKQVSLEWTYGHIVIRPIKEQP